MNERSRSEWLGERYPVQAAGQYAIAGDPEWFQARMDDAAQPDRDLHAHLVRAMSASGRAIDDAMIGEMQPWERRSLVREHLGDILAAVTCAATEMGLSMRELMIHAWRDEQKRPEPLPSAVCRTTGMQACHCCDNTACGDYTGGRHG
jgi:hypothetical protein